MVDLEGVGPEDLIKAAVETLRTADERWHAVSAPDYTAVTRRWEDDTVDTLLLLSPDSAYAVRVDPQDRPPWSMRGTLHQIVDQARKVAAPDSPDVPPTLGPDLPRAEWR